MTRRSHINVKVSFTKVCDFCTPGRLSYLYGLNGPSLAIDTACSSSLVAVSTARNALLLGVAGGAIAGGITLMLSPTTMAMYAVAGAVHGTV
jgi:acyl transferase domain-containing protein